MASIWNDPDTAPSEPTLDEVQNRANERDYVLKNNPFLTAGQLQSYAEEAHADCDYLLRELLQARADAQMSRAMSEAVRRDMSVHIYDTGAGTWRCILYRFVVRVEVEAGTHIEALERALAKLDTAGPGEGVFTLRGDSTPEDVATFREIRQRSMEGDLSHPEDLARLCGIADRALDRAGLL